MNIIEIVIKPKHFRLSERYTSTLGCPLALACQEHFNSDNISCNSYIVTNKNNGQPKVDVYKIVDSWCFKTPGLRNGTDETVDDLIKKAKQKKKVGNYIVKLIRY